MHASTSDGRKEARINRKSLLSSPPVSRKPENNAADNREESEGRHHMI